MVALGPLPLGPAPFHDPALAPGRLTRPLLYGPALGPLPHGPYPNFDFLDGFLRRPKRPKRFWPLRPPIGLRFGIFYITSRGRKDPVDGFGVCGPMARDRHPAIFRIFGPTPPWPLLFA